MALSISGKDNVDRQKVKVERLGCGRLPAARPALLLVTHEAVKDTRQLIFAGPLEGLGSGQRRWYNGQHSCLPSS